MAPSWLAPSLSNLLRVPAKMLDRTQSSRAVLERYSHMQGAVQLKLFADNQQVAAHVEQLRTSTPELAAADEPQQSSIRERSEEWCRQWHPRFPLPAPGADPPLWQQEADGSWQRVSQCRVVQPASAPHRHADGTERGSA